jgi:hypothetical protein
MKKYAFLLVAIFQYATAAEPARPIPTELFGLRLGEAYDIGDQSKGVKGDIPVKRFTGFQKVFGEGLHYFFEPLKPYKAFPYVEEKKSKSDKYFKSSFRAYIIPVIPDGISNTAELSQANLRYVPIVIEWSIKVKSEEISYFWAKDLCKTFAVDFDKQPEIFDFYKKEKKSYLCKFSADNREFEIAFDYSYKRVRLSYNTETKEAMQDAVEKKRRKIEANDINPQGSHASPSATPPTSPAPPGTPHSYPPASRQALEP